MATTVRNESLKHRYEILVDDERAGFVTYTIHGPTITFVSTEISSDFRGGGYGSILIQNALEDVRTNTNYTVVAQCPFTKKFLEKHPEFQDLLDRR